MLQLNSETIARKELYLLSKEHNRRWIEVLCVYNELFSASTYGNIASIEALPRASTLLSSVGVVDSSVPQEEIECDNTNQPASATPSMINPLLLNY